MVEMSVKRFIEFHALILDREIVTGPSLTQLCSYRRFQCVCVKVNVKIIRTGKEK